MAGLIKKGNKWHAFYRINGRARRPSTGFDVIPKDGMKPAQSRKLAEQAADILEQQEKKLITGNAAATALRALADMVDDAPILTAREYLTAYRPDGKVQNQANARRAVKLLLDFLTARKLDMLPLSEVKRKHCEDFLGELLQEVAVGTVRTHKAHVTAAFNRAIQAEMIRVNHFSAIKMQDIENRYSPETKGKDKTEKENFTEEEVQTILYSFPQPWSDLAAVGYFTGGQRIGDCYSLTWEQVDFERGLIRIKTQKTARNQVCPLLPELRRRLEARRTLTTDKEEPYVFPELVRIAERSKGRVSTDFTSLLRLHGILPEKYDQPKKKGRRKNVSPKSFHSLRHTTASFMQERGVSQAVSMDVVGHDSVAVHEAYTSTSLAARAEALSKLADAVRPTDATSTPNRNCRHD